MPGWGRGGRVLQCMDEAEGSHFCYVFDPILLRYMLGSGTPPPESTGMCVQGGVSCGG